MRRVDTEQLYSDNQGEAYLRKHGFHFGHKTGVLTERQLRAESARHEVAVSDRLMGQAEARRVVRLIEDMEDTYGWTLLQRAAVEVDLTPRQLDCLRGRYQGLTYRAIGSQCGCSRMTVLRELRSVRSVLVTALPHKSRNRLLWEVMLEVFGAEVLRQAGWEPAM